MQRGYFVTRKERIDTVNGMRDNLDKRFKYNGNFTFAQIPMPILMDNSLSASEKLIYSVVLSCHSVYGAACPSLKTIANAASLSPRSVSRTLSEMVKKGMVTRIEHQGAANTYLPASVNELYPFIEDDDMDSLSYFYSSEGRFNAALSKVKDNLTHDTSDVGTPLSHDTRDVGRDDTGVVQCTHNTSIEDSEVEHFSAETSFDRNSSPDKTTREDPRTKTDLDSRVSAVQQDSIKNRRPATPQHQRRLGVSPAVAEIENQAKQKASKARDEKRVKKAQKKKYQAMQGFASDEEEKPTQAKSGGPLHLYQTWQDQMKSIGFDQSGRKASKADLAKLKRLKDQFGFQKAEKMIMYCCSNWKKLKEEHWFLKGVSAPTISILCTQEKYDALMISMDRDTNQIDTHAEIDKENPWGFLDD